MANILLTCCVALRESPPLSESRTRHRLILKDGVGLDCSPVAQSSGYSGSDTCRGETLGKLLNFSVPWFSPSVKDG